MNGIDELIAAENALCRIDGDAIIFPVADDYDVMLSKCDTPEKILAWVVHLSGKSWMTPEALRLFVLHAAHHHGIQVYPVTG